MYIRRPPALALEWAAHETAIYDCVQLKRFRVSPTAVSLLNSLGSWTDKEQVTATYGDDIVRALIDHGLIEFDAVGNHTTLAVEDNPWHKWGPSVAHFHAVSSSAQYLTSGDDRQSLAEEMAAGAQPSFYKNAAGRYPVSLPEPPAIASPLTEALTARRTHRLFSDSPIEIKELSALLHYSFRTLGYKDAGPFGRIPLRASPCAGGRNEIEAYLFALNVEDMSPGLYHYSPRDHRLGLLDGSVTRERLLEATFDQPALRTPPAIIALTAVIERVSCKYPHARAYRLLTLNAGHTGQTFALVGTALGLGVYQSAAFADATLARILKIDYPKEIPTYILAAGSPERS